MTTKWQKNLNFTRKFIHIENRNLGVTIESLIINVNKHVYVWCIVTPSTIISDGLKSRNFEICQKFITFETQGTIDTRHSFTVKLIDVWNDGDKRAKVVRFSAEIFQFPVETQSPWKFPQTHVNNFFSTTNRHCANNLHVRVSTMHESNLPRIFREKRRDRTRRSRKTAFWCETSYDEWNTLGDREQCTRLIRTASSTWRRAKKKERKSKKKKNKNERERESGKKRKNCHSSRLRLSFASPTIMRRPHTRYTRLTFPSTTVQLVAEVYMANFNHIVREYILKRFVNINSRLSSRSGGHAESATMFVGWKI